VSSAPKIGLKLVGCRLVLVHSTKTNEEVWYRALLETGLQKRGLWLTILGGLKILGFSIFWLFYMICLLLVFYLAFSYDVFILLLASIWESEGVNVMQLQYVSMVSCSMVSCSLVSC
jgi:hypothetical protein